MERETSEGQMLYTKPQLEQCIRECMAGRAAEILYYGGEDGLSTGASDDLRRASQLAARMVSELGMDDEIGPIAVDVLVGGNALDGLLGTQVVQQSRQILITQMQQVMTFLEDNRLTLDTLVNGLIDKNRLAREDLEKLLKE